MLFLIPPLIFELVLLRGNFSPVKSLLNLGNRLSTITGVVAGGATDTGWLEVRRDID
jgi:hypothetical protein